MAPIPLAPSLHQDQSVLFPAETRHTAPQQRRIRFQPRSYHPMLWPIGEGRSLLDLDHTFQFGWPRCFGVRLRWADRQRTVHPTGLSLKALVGVGTRHWQWRQRIPAIASPEAN